AAGLGALVLADAATLWHVYGFALALGVVSTLDAPVRQTFVSEMVDDAYLSNAVALNATSFNAARMIGPAVAGVLVASIGSGWVFLLNTLTFGAMLAAVLAIRADELRGMPRSGRGRGQIREGLAYVAGRPDIVAVLVTIFLIGTFG